MLGIAHTFLPGDRSPGLRTADKSAVRNWSHRVQIAPAVVYEALRLRDVPLRNRLVALMTNRRFERLMPEAYNEAMEILAEIRRLRPDWLAPIPTTLSSYAAATTGPERWAAFGFAAHGRQAKKLNASRRWRARS